MRRAIAFGYDAALLAGRAAFYTLISPVLLVGAVLAGYGWAKSHYPTFKESWDALIDSLHGAE